MPATIQVRNSLSTALAQRGIHFGWVMVGLAFVNALFATAAVGVPSVLIVPMAADLGWSIGELSAPTGLRLALYGLSAPFAGGLMMRYGPRRMVGLSGALLIVGLALSIITTEKWQLWLGMGFLLGIAPGLTAMQLASVVASRWFTSRQGLVLGIMMGATATGVLIFMPLAAMISEAWGWRAAMALPSVGCIFSLGLFYLFAYDRPEDIQLPRFGELEVASVPPPYKENFVVLSFQALALGAKSWVFWVLAFTFAVCGISSYGITQAHIVPFCGDIGVPFAAAAWLLAVIGVSDLIGTTGSGWLSDRYDNRWLLFFYYGLRGLGLIWLVSSDPSYVMLTIFAVVYGLDFIATVPPTVKLAVAEFGREMGPSVFGWIFAAHHVAAGVMTYGAGLSRDQVGSYVPAFMFAGIACLIAAASVYLLERPEPQDIIEPAGH
jgi:predicted MFS family arabinose efflux permease